MDNITDLTAIVKQFHGDYLNTDRPCKNCGNTRHELRIGAGPHIARYRCGECLAFVAWVSKSEIIKIYREG